ncbi:MAG: glutamine-hydrolyzing carbamoyl-phosphate synthase small subunit [Bacteroidota bacterium]|jgi:carbamoyl-phosphate synthase small subunit
MPTRVPAVLLLDDGTYYSGFAAGKIGTTTGELCFNTGMTGYQEIFTDPSYYGQIMVNTHVHVGNYGIKHDEIESESIKIAGLVTKSFNVTYSRKLADQNIEDYFLNENKVAITGVDTRAIVRHIRDKGAMNALISSETTDILALKVKLDQAPSMSGLELSSIVSTTKAYTFGTEDAPVRIAVLDLGVKKNILRCFAERGCFLKVFPARTDYNEMATFNPHGYFISNGPGDPASMDYAIHTVRTILDKNLPLFGICLGHQLLALANGIETFKMHNGHRGINHPVKNLITGGCEITSQNHGFGVLQEAVQQNKEVEVTHLNLNDQSVEGIRLRNKKAFSVQYHPESSPGPHDSRYLFDQFIQLITT